MIDVLRRRLHEKLGRPRSLEGLFGDFLVATQVEVAELLETFRHAEGSERAAEPSEIPPRKPL